MKKIIWAILIVGPVMWFVYHARFGGVVDTAETPRVTVNVVENRITFPITAKGGTVEDFLAQTHYALSADDRVLPPRDTAIVPGMTIEVIRVQKVRVIVDGSTQDCESYASDVRSVLRACGIDYVDTDEVTPAPESPVTAQMTITVAHIITKEEEREINIPFKTVTQTDRSVAFGTTQTIEEGREGRATVTERVTFTGGVETDRKEISRDIIAAPKNKIVAIGEKLTLGKSHTGAASWYAYKGCDCAANPWLPKGSYVKVTNTANDKSVVVRINDRGPFVPGRIIDLDVTAFEKIASPYRDGVIDVIMEEVK